jgi:hypothetical protein
MMILNKLPLDDSKKLFWTFQGTYNELLQLHFCEQTNI